MDIVIQAASLSLVVTPWPQQQLHLQRGSRTCWLFPQRMGSQPRLVHHHLLPELVRQSLPLPRPQISLLPNLPTSVPQREALNTRVSSGPSTAENPLVTPPHSGCRREFSPWPTRFQTICPCHLSTLDPSTLSQSLCPNIGREKGKGKGKKICQVIPHSSSPPLSSSFSVSELFYLPFLHQNTVPGLHIAPSFSLVLKWHLPRRPSQAIPYWKCSL